MSRVTSLRHAALMAAALAATPLWAADASQPNGAQIYTRCAACHTMTGAGVPGAFPPLGENFRTLADSPEGRRYMSLAVIRGLMGPIVVDGKKYNGIMPAQGGLDDAAVAAVLNHVGEKIATKGPAFKAFSPSEVAKARASGKTLDAAAVARLRPEATVR